MQPSLAPLLKFEMFYRVGHITLRAVDAGLLQAFVEQTASGTDEWMAFQVFFIAGLFADKDHPRPCFALTKNQLSGVPVEVTSFAAFRLSAQGTQ